MALNVLKIESSVRLLSNPNAAFLLWIPRLTGTKQSNTFGLGQLSFNLSLSDDISTFGSSFSTTGIPVSEFARYLPIGRRYGIDLLKQLLSSCLAGNIFLPGRYSSHEVKLDKHGSLVINGGYQQATAEIMRKIESSLRKAYLLSGALLIPGSFKTGKPGSDIHYAGTLPMRNFPKLGETNPNGELFGLRGVFVVDGSSLPTLSEKSHTLTLMANADRIGRIISTR
jgi:choline dehydrogenase-like flavoprotein